jgi:hypothetical protein
MKVGMPHAPYIANKIALDLFNSGYVTFFKGLDPVKKCAQNFIEEDIKKEAELEAKVVALLEENEDEMEFMRVDRRDMFWLIKKKIARDFNFILSYEDRYSEVSHKVMDKLWEDGLMDYHVTENTIKNVIFSAIESYIEEIDAIEDVVYDKISKMSKKYIPGTDEYNALFERLYREELQRKGMM